MKILNDLKTISIDFFAGLSALPVLIFVLIKRFPELSIFLVVFIYSLKRIKGPFIEINKLVDYILDRYNLRGKITHTSLKLLVSVVLAVFLVFIFEYFKIM